MVNVLPEEPSESRRSYMITPSDEPDGLAAPLGPCATTVGPSVRSNTINPVEAPTSVAIALERVTWCIERPPVVAVFTTSLQGPISALCRREQSRDHR